jgi:ribonuclease HI
MIIDPSQRSSLRDLVLQKYSLGPHTGVFTDGSAQPNPGPGGWGVVVVENGVITYEACGHDSDTTNNRMELSALIFAFKALPLESTQVVYSDSNLCVKTVNEWAAGWERNGWRRKSGPISNLELVKELYSLARGRPHVTLKWIEAHNGWKWNEYADCLSTEWTRLAMA